MAKRAKAKARSAKRAPAKKASRASAKKVRAIPTGYEGITPYICCKQAAKAIDFYKRAFGAKERLRMPAPGDKVGHAEIKIGNALVMLCDEFPDFATLSPQTVGGSPVMLHVYVKDVDGFVKRAVAEGAKLERGVADQFYGDRGGKLTDPFGHIWWIATRIEDVKPAELRKRAAKMMGTAAS